MPLVGPLTGNGFRIEQVWVAVMSHGQDDESVPMVRSPNGDWISLTVSSPKLLSWLKARAREVSTDAGKPVTIVCFRLRVDMETIAP